MVYKSYTALVHWNILYKSGGVVSNYNGPSRIDSNLTKYFSLFRFWTFTSTSPREVMDMIKWYLYE